MLPIRLAACAALCLPLSLSGCGQTEIIERPVPVEVVRTEFVPIPADLTEPGAPAVIPDGLTYGDALELWAVDRATIETQAERLRQIRAIGQP